MPTVEETMQLPSLLQTYCICVTPKVGFRMSVTKGFFLCWLESYIVPLLALQPHYTEQTTINILEKKDVSLLLIGYFLIQQTVLCVVTGNWSLIQNDCNRRFISSLVSVLVPLLATQSYHNKKTTISVLE